MDAEWEGSGLQLFSGTTYGSPEDSEEIMLHHMWMCAKCGKSENSKS
jgi:hypothetical protein